MLVRRAFGVYEGCIRRVLGVHRGVSGVNTSYTNHNFIPYPTESAHVEPNSGGM